MVIHLCPHQDWTRTTPLSSAGTTGSSCGSCAGVSWQSCYRGCLRHFWNSFKTRNAGRRPQRRVTTTTKTHWCTTTRAALHRVEWCCPIECARCSPLRLSDGSDGAQDGGRCPRMHHNCIIVPPTTTTNYNSHHRPNDVFFESISSSQMNGTTSHLDGCAPQTNKRVSHE
jgi:hypothetical protein